MIYQSDRLPLEICLGRAGENNVTIVSFDMTPIISVYPVKSIHILAQRPGEDFSYSVVTEFVEPILHWTVSSADTANEGAGLAEIVVITEDGTKLSSVTKTKILPSLYSEQQEDPPPVIKPWLDKEMKVIFDLTDQATDAADQAKKYADSITEMRTEATTLSPGSDAAVTYDSSSGLLSFGIPEGQQGKIGPRGSKGDKGDPGFGIPAGGTTGQVLSKRGATDYDTQWIDPPQSGTGPSSDMYVLEQIANGTYQGTDLTVKFASEIAGYANPWEWIKVRIRAGDFSGIFVCDYIPFTTTNGRTFQAQIAGINTYKGYGDREIGNHIDFITRELWPELFPMNKVNINNGTSWEKRVPWLASNGYMFVNSLAGQVPNSTAKPYEMVDVDYTAGGMYFYLPDELKAVIVEKRVCAPTRFSESGILKNDNGMAFVNMGKLWLPDEYEIAGTRLMTTTGGLGGGFVQYPIFTYGMNRLKHMRGGNNRANWCTSSALAASSEYFVAVNYRGRFDCFSSSYALRMPFCFRVS